MKKNVTLSADALLLERAREAARVRGKTLNQLFRDYLTSLVGADGRENWLAEFADLATQGAGNSGGKPVRREELYDRPVLHRH